MPVGFTRKQRLAPRNFIQDTHESSVCGRGRKEAKLRTEKVDYDPVSARFSAEITRNPLSVVVAAFIDLLIPKYCH